MSRSRAVPDGWHSAADLAARFGRSEREIEALVRRHHWPRVFQEHGALVGADLDVIAQALATMPTSAHGSLPPRE